MHVVLLGGAPGVGKSTVCRHLLVEAMGGTQLVQCVDVDALWQHQPWRVDERTKAMVQRNLRAVLANGADAGVDIAVVAWVFQSADMHDLVRSLTPLDSTTTTVQLVVDEATWRARVGADEARPPIDDFFAERYRAAQVTPADHVVDTTDRPADAVARAVMAIIGS